MRSSIKALNQQLELHSANKVRFTRPRRAVITDKLLIQQALFLTKVMGAMLLWDMARTTRLVAVKLMWSKSNQSTVQ